MKILVPFAEGFEETEAVTIVDVLRRAGIGVDTVGIPGTSVIGGHSIRVNTDKRLAEINVDDYDGIVLPGGNRGTENLVRTAQVIEMIKKFNSKGKLVGAICAAPLVLVKAGILENKKATIHPGMERELPHPRSDPVVVDGNVVTSQGVGTALDFSLKLVEILVGKGKVFEIRSGLVV